ncbi:MAG: 2-oxoglutarate dehydrogenase E1 component [Alphaproteobacteria bacterium]|nr:2-oxoglutarate dehydrogenase E1 component [Alphaproteobacteria bacterium]
MSGSHLLATALSGGNAAFIAEIYAKWVDNPAAIDPSWAEVFAALNEDARAVLKDLEGATWRPRKAGIVNGEAEAAAPVAAREKGAQERGAQERGARPAAPARAGAPAALSAEQVRAATVDSIRALMLIRAYRVRGHLEADLDPLGLNPPAPHPELDPRSYGFSDADLDRPIFIDGVLGFETATLRQILAVLRATYCGKIGVEFMHIQDPDQKAWIQRRIEGDRNIPHLPADEKKTILRLLTEAEGFERFCQVKYTGTKRFGLEGGESTIPAMEAMLAAAARLGVEEVVVGMPHRGRLNLLANTMKKPFTAIFSEFQGNQAHPDDMQGSGDVKYHLGASVDREIGGRMVHLSLTANPSHLEAVNPVVVGKVRAKQEMLIPREASAEEFRAGIDRMRGRIMAILLHGDAAFAGQGLVEETLDLSQLIGYRTGGTIHLIVNNQIGFTTVPAHARTGHYCTEVAKTVQAPIVHVNGDDPEAVVHAARLCAEFRQQFHCDVVLDIVCYRRQGHNEADEPAFTQPTMYRKIGALASVRTIYAEKLAAEGTIAEGEAEAMNAAFTATLEQAFQAAKTWKPNKADWLDGRWSGLTAAGPDDERHEEGTAVDLDTLREVGAALVRVPVDFKANPKILRQLDAKRRMIETGEGIDWGTGEALAFGSLLVEGHPVRLSGQDCQRGTFSHRHAVLIDQASDADYTPLNHIREKRQARIFVFNSPLSEAGVLGFDYGYSLADPHTLVCWEAQFGDFANGAQVIIDQFIASSESKWLRMSGLVMLLPHGYEGQGPEHSSARLERYLQLCAERNMQVCNLTTPANYFHALRRQIHRNFRKPLVIMAPKSLLRHKLAVSALAEMGPGSGFRFVYPETDELVAPAKVKRVVLCTGKVYYDLLATRREKGVRDVAIIRVEQLYPFPQISLGRELARYPKAEVVWCQEEPENMGAWTFVDRRIEKVLAGLDVKAKRPVYAGRTEAASPATGLYKVHNAEQEQLVREALMLG